MVLVVVVAVVVVSLSLCRSASLKTKLFWFWILRDFLIFSFLNLKTSKTQQSSETSSIFELDNVKNEAILRQVDNIKNEAILRDVLQKWKVQCRADGLVPVRFAIFPLHLSKLPHLPRKSDARSYEVLHLARKIIFPKLKIWCSKMQPLSGNQRRDLLAALMNMSLVQRLPRKMHLCRHACYRFWKCYKTLTICSLLTRCTIPCACHAKRHLNVKKWSGHVDPPSNFSYEMGRTWATVQIASQDFFVQTGGVVPPILYLESFCSWFLSNHHFYFVVVYVELVEASNIKSH